jgi:hypothetical protein
MRHFFTLICVFLLAGNVVSEKILLDTEEDEPILEQLELVEWNETGEIFGGVRVGIWLSLSRVLDCFLF